MLNTLKRLFQLATAIFAQDDEQADPYAFLKWLMIGGICYAVLSIVG